MPRSDAVILFVDDQPESLEAMKLLIPSTHIIVRHPADVERGDIVRADLVMVDLKLTEWRDRLAAVSQSPADGLALAGVLRSHVEELAKPRPTTFALYSSHLDEIWGNLPAEYRAHAMARDRNLEWVFEKPKSAPRSEAGAQLLSLAKATKSLPAVWPQGDYDATRKVVSGLLGLKGRLPWKEEAWQDVESCHPPVHDLIEQTHGVVFLRWLLQRILPYPCYLWNETQLGVRLGVDARGLNHALDGEVSDLSELAACRYQGILSDFLGPRWWRSGVEAALWKLTDGNSSSLAAVRSILSDAGLKNAPLPDELRIICIDETFRALPDLQPPDAVVRIQPDDWPPYADHAWTTLSLAKTTPKLRALVVAEERARLDASD